MINPRSWLLWVLVMAAIIMVARNPFYAVLLLLVIQIVKVGHGREDIDFAVPLLRIALVILVLGALYNAFFFHSGETILFQMPALPLIGGPITLEALVHGLSNGITLVALLALFIAFNAIVPASELLRMTPMALRDVGVVILVAFTYIPETRRHLVHIREAQAIRGHEMQGFGDWRPVIVPLLIGGLERSMQIAESMVARGYGSLTDRSSNMTERILLVVCLLSAVFGWLLALWLGWQGWLLIFISLGSVILLMWHRGKQSRRTNLNPSRLSLVDGLVIASTLVALMIIIGLSRVDAASLVWNAYPTVTIPDLDWRVGLAILLLAAPIIITNNHD